MASGCVAILEGRDVDAALVLALGGPHATFVLTGRESGKTGSWPRVWAARGLLYAWEDSATPAVVRAATDEAWRVREMVARVVARHRLEDALSAVIELQGDQVRRVRVAAERAVIKIVVGNHA